MKVLLGIGKFLFFGAIWTLVCYVFLTCIFGGAENENSYGDTTSFFSLNILGGSIGSGSGGYPDPIYMSTPVEE